VVEVDDEVDVEVDVDEEVVVVEVEVVVFEVDEDEEVEVELDVEEVEIDLVVLVELIVVEVLVVVVVEVDVVEVDVDRVVLVDLVVEVEVDLVVEVDEEVVVVDEEVVVVLVDVEVVVDVDVDVVVAEPAPVKAIAAIAKSSALPVQLIVVTAGTATALYELPVFQVPSSMLIIVVWPVATVWRLEFSSTKPSTTTELELTVVIFMVGKVLAAKLVAVVSTGAIWSTPIQDVASERFLALLVGAVTTTLFAPVAGAINLHTCTPKFIAGAISAILVSATPA